VAAIAVSAIYAVATIPMTPALISSHPVLLELLTGSNTAVVVAGSFAAVHGKLQLAVVIFAALPGIMRFDWVYWWAGRLWGHRIVERLSERSPRAAGLVTLAERRGRRIAAPLVAVSAFLPGGIPTPVYAAAGWVGVPLLVFVIADTIGSLVWISVLAGSGYLLGRDGVTLANLISRYAVITICVLAVLTFGPQAWRTLRDRLRRPAPVPAASLTAAPEPGSAQDS
jgi:membrane protein DedA with SNARE-associated domain